jgi:hypothetical protein
VQEQVEGVQGEYEEWIEQALEPQLPQLKSAAADIASEMQRKVQNMHTPLQTTCLLPLQIGGLCCLAVKAPDFRLMLLDRYHAFRPIWV